MENDYIDYIKLGLYVATPLLLSGIYVYLNDNSERFSKKFVNWLMQDEPLNQAEESNLEIKLKWQIKN